MNALRYFFAALALLCLLPLHAAASAGPKAIAVLDQEQRWIHAIAQRDAKTLASILSENFVHVNYRGELRYREEELAQISKGRPYQQNLGEQTVDFAGDAAVVHGVNTVRKDGKLVVRLRYTDVYRLESGTWKAISAQETTITAK